MSELNDYNWLDEMGDFDPVLSAPGGLVPPGKIIEFGDIDGCLIPDVKHPNAKPLVDFHNAVVEMQLVIDDRNQRLIDELVADAVAAELAREERIALVAASFGWGYARIDRGFSTDYALSSQIPAGQKYDFPSPEAFAAWAERGRP